MNIRSVRVGVLVTALVATALVVCACSGSAGNGDLFGENGGGGGGGGGAFGGGSDSKTGSGGGESVSDLVKKPSQSDAGAHPLDPSPKTSSSGDPAVANVCTAEADDTTCDQCIKGSCCSEAKACRGDADCVAAAKCGMECPDEACLDKCATAHPTGGGLYRSLLSCVSRQCGSRCQ